MKVLAILIAFLGVHSSVFSQDMMPLVNKVKAKLDKVNDYVAEGNMKTDVAFIKAPVGKVKVYFKKPNRFKLKRDGGISILPKGGVTVNMSTLIAGNEFVALAVGDNVVNGTKVKVVKLVPTSDNSDVVLSTLYIDEANLLILKAATTTKENGSFEIEMTYGKYMAYALPDKLNFSFNTKDYKMPKGIALEFDDEEKQTEAEKIKRRKGRVQINYTKYTINEGVADSVFK
ncbi:LolA family protein [Parasediminibacterium sp. JCM 36343]|uniref:LolA family protein n=1 Tax=Parasediminibacterium sp. JCM 36343 TaxID=3374279 RepID=UPI00397BB096